MYTYICVYSDIHIHAYIQRYLLLSYVNVCPECRYAMHHRCVYYTNKRTDLLAQNTLKTNNTLDALVAQGSAVAQRARGTGGRHLYNHLGVLRLHLALHLHQRRDLCIEGLLLAAQL